MQTYTPANLGSKRVKTPEGFLLCKDVAFARTGEMLYAAGQIPVKPGADGVARVTRGADVVFDPATLDSMLGKSVTMRHPPKAVDSTDWRLVEAGTILNARRGSGPQSEFLIGDIIVKDQETIDMLDAGDKIEVSLGYHAKYEDDGNGRGRQTKITGNHLALLPPGVKGRCGPDCYVGDAEGFYIGDQAMDVEEPTMTEKTTGGLALLRKLLGAKTEDEAALVLDAAASDAATQAMITDLSGQVTKLTATVEKLTKDGDKEEETAEEKKARLEKEEKEKETHDAAAIQDLHARVSSAAEILSPGLTIPTMDAADLTATFDAICGCQKTALVNAGKTDAGKKALESLIGTVDVSKLTADQIGANFFAASKLVGLSNNGDIAAMLGGQAMRNEIQTNIDRSAAADAASKTKWDAVRAARQTQH